MSLPGKQKQKKYFEGSWGSLGLRRGSVEATEPLAREGQKNRCPGCVVHQQQGHEASTRAIESLCRYSEPAAAYVMQIWIMEKCILSRMILAKWKKISLSPS